MLRYSFSLILLLLSCHPDDIGFDFKPHFDSFLSDAKRYGVNVDYRSVTFIKATLPDTIRAQATLGSFHRDKTIKVNKVWWGSAPDTERKAVLYHEFGHAFLQRGHISIRVSLMNPSVPIYEWNINEEELIEELFKNK